MAGANGRTTGVATVGIVGIAGITSDEGVHVGGTVAYGGAVVVDGRCTCGRGGG